MLTLKDIELRVKEVDKFSHILYEILDYILKDNESIKTAAEKRIKDIEESFQKDLKKLDGKVDDNFERLSEGFKKENAERIKDLKELDSSFKRENGERSKEIGTINQQLNAENDKRIQEANALKEKMDKEKRELQAYLAKDANEMKEKIQADKEALQAKLNQEAQDLKERMLEENEERVRESKAITEKMKKDKELLEHQMKIETQLLDEKMAQEEDKRKAEAEKLQSSLEASKKEQGNEITQMFDRLKSENECRRGEIHGLKDILVRENENRVKEIKDVRDALDVNVQTLGEVIQSNKEDVVRMLKHSDDDHITSLLSVKKELREKIENEGNDIRKKIDLETSALDDKIQVEKVSLTNKMDEDDELRRKELRLITAHIKKDRDDLKEQMESDAKTLLTQLEKDSTEIVNLIKREKGEREKEQGLTKERMANEKKELQISIDKDRDNLTRKLNEEHDMRRLEQMEMQERLDNAEKQGKSDIAELYQKIKKESDMRENENEDLLNQLKNDKNAFDEKIIKERQALREVIDGENLDLNKRLDKVNSDRLHDSTELQGKMSLFGKSASRHIDNLKQSVYRECQLLFDLATKPCSVLFNAYRDDSYSAGGEDYITFTGTSVNIGNHMDPKSGIFLIPEDGTYLFLLSVCTYDMKKCLLSIRKNGKDISNLFDQDGMENKGKTMIGQNLVLDLCTGDKIQIYAYTSTGLTDHKNSRYTQFVGMLLRSSAETLSAFSRRLCDAENAELVDDGDESVAECSIRSRKARRSRNRMLFSPPPNITTSPVSTSRLPEPERNGTAEPPKRNDSSVPRNTVILESPLEETEKTEVNGESKKQNGDSQKTNGDSQKTNGEPQKTNGEPHKTNGESLKTNGASAEEDEPKGQMSYLALTNLGMGKKAGSEAELNGAKNGKEESKKKPKEKKARKSITEIAANSLKGVTKKS